MSWTYTKIITYCLFHSYTNSQCWYLFINLSIIETHYPIFFIIISPSILPYIIMQHTRRIDFIYLI